MSTPVISLRLDPELDAWIRKVVAKGQFKTRTEVIAAAVERMREEARKNA